MDSGWRKSGTTFCSQRGVHTIMAVIRVDVDGVGQDLTCPGFWGARGLGW